jgi:phosphatidylinositol-3-phosphatase
MSRRLAAVAAMAIVAGGASSTAATAAVPQVNHVFIVVLENENAETTFGQASPIPYLAKTLTGKGAYLPNYYATGHESLDNYISMVSGQAPNIQTQADCQIFSEFAPGIATSDGQFIGQGCVYPQGVQNIATQLEGAGFSWRGYMQDMANSAPAQPSSCRHPSIGSHDPTQDATATDQYAARHNPFVYFHSIIDSPTCQQNDVDLSRLGPDLASEATTPNYAFITPDLCNDGHDEPCVDGQPGGMKQANTFLQGLVPEILSSPAYRNRGLLIVTFDEAEGEPGDGDASACCNEQPGPNTVNPGGPVPGPGGGRIGAVMLSPCIQPGTVSHLPYNHYSLLRSVENNFGLPLLGYAGQAGLKPFGSEILNQPGCPVPGKRCKKKKRHKKHRRHAAAAKKKHKHKKCKRKKRPKHKARR